METTHNGDHVVGLQASSTLAVLPDRSPRVHMLSSLLEPSIYSTRFGLSCMREARTAGGYLSLSLSSCSAAVTPHPAHTSRSANLCPRARHAPPHPDRIMLSFAGSCPCVHAYMCVCAWLCVAAPSARHLSALAYLSYPSARMHVYAACVPLAQIVVPHIGPASRARARRIHCFTPAAQRRGAINIDI